MAIHVVGYEDKFHYEGNRKVITGRALLHELWDTADYKTIHPGDVRPVGRYTDSAPIQFVEAEPFDADLELSNDHAFGSSRVALHDPVKNIYYPMFKTDYAHMTSIATVDHGRISGRFGFVKKNTKFGIKYLGDKVSATDTQNEISQATFEKLVDVMLENAGVPRNDLFEYPYNEFESRDLLKKAEATVRRTLGILNLKVEKK